MNFDKIIIERITEKQIPESKQVIAKAFYGDNLFGYFFPNNSHRLDYIEHYFENMLNFCVKNGVVNSIHPGGIGYALWLPSKVIYENTLQKSSELECVEYDPQLPIKSVELIHAYNKYIDALHTLNAPNPHCYLDLIAVNPIHQGKGYATALLNKTLLQLDDLGIPSYLVTQNVKNVSLYKHFNFKIISHSLIPGTDIPHWEMSRL
ncbi:MAG: GNAT family N-acetyltransferase [Candidatus Methanomethylophilaceae archaeon]|jgi:GNAT superfamily N-acetyltransferase|nr:GNAT family N-acetyltransferase [Candidatus Methanomethylophilaceae archaeon]MDD3069130.1 GNAT family N-acetyltransferase [Bacilli bacterium]MDY0224273.1 GNAT family N-acetyltransferase [Candidatus Methanomethylophilaceae archaeon]MDY3202889.1 GNAT family N-acetyltransferase [Methanocorpusculum sp.]